MTPQWPHASHLCYCHTVKDFVHKVTILSIICQFYHLLFLWNNIFISPPSVSWVTTILVECLNDQKTHKYPKGQKDPINITKLFYCSFTYRLRWNIRKQLSDWRDLFFFLFLFVSFSWVLLQRKKPRNNVHNTVKYVRQKILLGPRHFRCD